MDGECADPGAGARLAVQGDTGLGEHVRHPVVARLARTAEVVNARHTTRAALACVIGLVLDDDDGFREFVRMCLPALSRVAYLLTGDHFAAEDLVQSALIKLAERWKRLARDGNPEAYVRKTLYHEHISAWRYRRARPEVSAERIPERAAGRDEAVDAVNRIALRAALAKLTRKQRAVLVLRFFEDLSEADTAQALGCSIGNVKSQTSHALARLRVVAPELARPLEERTLR